MIDIARIVEINNEVYHKRVNKYLIYIMFNDQYQKDLEKELIKDYKNYTNRSFSTQLVSNYYEHLSMYRDVVQCRVYPFKIRKNKVYLDMSIIEKCKTLEYSLKDGRIESLKNLLKETIDWCVINKLKIPDTTLFIWNRDKVPNMVKKDIDFPFIVYSKPKGVNYPIFPDTTFDCMTLQEKYGGSCYDWDRIKEVVENECLEIKEKDSKFYFKGTSTGEKYANVRKRMVGYDGEKPPMEIYLDAWDIYEPLYSWCKYKYLLNLPGHFPWSNRFKYLFLMKSIVVDVNVKTHHIDLNKIDDEWISFTNYIVKKNKDYVGFVIDYYRTGEYSKKYDDMNKKALDDLFVKLIRLYQDSQKNPKKYDKIVKSGYDKMTKLTNERVYQYIYRMILLNSTISFD